MKKAKSKTDDLTFKIIKDYGELENNKHLLRISWNDGPERLEIRKVFVTQKGETKVGKGIEISRADAEQILRYLDTDPKPVNFDDVFESARGIMEKRDAGLTTDNGYIVLKRKK